MGVASVPSHRPSASIGLRASCISCMEIESLWVLPSMVLRLKEDVLMEDQIIFDLAVDALSLVVNVCW